MIDSEEILKRIQIPNIEELKHKAEQGDKDAQFKLAELYENGFQVNVDYNKAFRLYEQSSQQENMEALFKLGIMYYKGMGIKKDLEKAESIFKKAIDFFEKRELYGDKNAMYYLGYAFENGFGVEQNVDSAIYYYSDLQNYNVKAITRLGYLYQHGEGIYKDLKKAKVLYEVAIEKGDIEALINLGILYDSGM